MAYLFPRRVYKVNISMAVVSTPSKSDHLLGATFKTQNINSCLDYILQTQNHLWSTHVDAIVSVVCLAAFISVRLFFHTISQKNRHS